LIKPLFTYLVAPIGNSGEGSRRNEELVSPLEYVAVLPPEIPCGSRSTMRCFSGHDVKHHFAGREGAEVVVTVVIARSPIVFIGSEIHFIAGQLHDGRLLRSAD
jgi:hypothetical protein